MICLLFVLKALEAINGRYTDGQAKQIAKTLKDPDEENRLLACQFVRLS